MCEFNVCTSECVCVSLMFVRVSVCVCVFNVCTSECVCVCV